MTSQRPYCWFACDVTAAMLLVKNKSISLLWLGTKLYFHVNTSRKNSIVLDPNMAALSRGCKPRIGVREKQISSQSPHRDRLHPLAIDLIHDTRHLCKRLTTDGTKATSRGFSGGKQVRKFANTEKESFSKLYGGLLIVIRRAYIFQTNKFYFSQVRSFLSIANVKFSSKQTSSIGIIAKQIGKQC